jgi:KaiC/GvpD/RAD55 family RecA-like ATPase
MPDFPQPYWSEWADRIIGQFNLTRHGNGAQAEWHGGCPCCGGVDRFWIKERDAEVKAFCRQGCTITDISKALTEAGCWPSAKGDNVLSFQPAITAEDFAGDIMVPYHERKKVDLLGAKLVGDNVVVSIFNAQREKIGSQTISPDGGKKFNSGLAKEGAFAATGKLSGGLAYIAEGWATAASVTMATEQACVVALDAGNLPKVVEVFAQYFPDIELIVAADNDDAGIKAAKKSGCRWAVPSEKDADWNDVWVKQGAWSVQQGLALAKHTAGLFTKASDIEMTPPKWLVEGMLEQEALSMMFGASGSGKTFVALDVALSIAAGKDYHGKAVEQAPTLFVCGEGHAGFARRMAAWAAHNEISLDDVPFYKSNATVIMNDEQDAEHMMAEIDALVESIGKPKLIVLDTMDRTLAGSDSDDKDAAAYLNVCDQVRLKYGCTVLIVHHTGHNHTERARGSTRLKGRLDAEYRVESWGATRLIVTATKMKDAEEPEPMTFMMVDIPLHTNDGAETNSLALEWCADKKADKKDPEHIKAVILGQILKLDPMGEVQRNDLKEAVGLELECSQRTANRHIKRLVDEGVIKAAGGVIRSC